MEKDYILAPGLLIQKSSSSQSYLCSFILWTDCAKVSSPVISFVEKHDFVLGIVLVQSCL